MSLRRFSAILHLREKVLARLSRLHGKFSARLAGIPAGRAEVCPCNREVDL